MRREERERERERERKKEKETARERERERAKAKEKRNKGERAVRKVERGTIIGTFLRLSAGFGSLSSSSSSKAMGRWNGTFLLYVLPSGESQKVSAVGIAPSAPKLYHRVVQKRFAPLDIGTFLL